MSEGTISRDETEWGEGWGKLKVGQERGGGVEGGVKWEVRAVFMCSM